MGEAVTMGIIGGAIGVGLGLAGAELVTKMSPKLTAVVGQTTGSATPGGARQFGFPGAGTGGGTGGTGTFGGGGGGGGFGAAFRNANAAGHTVAVHLAASVSSNVILLAVVLAVAGGIIAGTFGGWRAARLRPAAALSKVA
jgi:ABC-type antimicrobial peptide transport system permease subunit